MTAPGLCCCAWAFSGFRERGYAAVAGLGLLVAAASLMQSTGSGAQELWHMGLVAPQHVASSQIRDQPVSAALAGVFLSAGPPGKLQHCIFRLRSKVVTFKPFSVP